MMLQITETQAGILTDLVDNRIEYLQNFEAQDTKEMAELKECRILQKMLNSTI
jgi:hypothetical protein